MALRRSSRQGVERQWTALDMGTSSRQRPGAPLPLSRRRRASGAPAALAILARLARHRWPGKGRAGAARLAGPAGGARWGYTRCRWPRPGTALAWQFVVPHLTPELLPHLYARCAAQRHISDGDGHSSGRHPAGVGVGRLFFLFFLERFPSVYSFLGKAFPRVSHENRRAMEISRRIWP